MNVSTQERTAMDDVVDVAPSGNLPVARQADNRFYREAPAGPSLPVTGFANIATAIAMIMSEIGVVGEGGENKFQNYKYMSYKDMFRKLTPLMGKHGLAVIPTEKTKSLFDNDAVVMGTYQFTIIHKSGEVWPFQPEWTGVSRARDSKGGFDDKALNKCATAAQKYFLKALFQIPSGEDDEDPDNHDGIVQGQRSAPQRRAPVPSPSSPQPRGPVQQAAPIVQPSKPEEGPHKIVGGTYATWTSSYIEAVQSAGDAATVYKWVDANQLQLEKLAAGAPQEAAKARAETEKHLVFLRKTEPKATAEPADMFPGDTPMESTQAAEPAPARRGRPPKPKVPDFAKDYDAWVNWCLKQVAEAETPEAIETLFESIDAKWEDLLGPDKEALMGARREAESRMEQ
jgi:hypothetical protein